MKLQLYTASELPEPRGPAPADPYDTAGRAYQQVSRDFAQLSNETERTAGTLIELNKAEKASRQYIDVVNQITQYQQDYAKEDAKMRAEPGWDYTTHDQKLKEMGDRLMGEQLAKMNDPLAARKFRDEATQYNSKQVINAIHDRRLRVAGEQQAALSTRVDQITVQAANELYEPERQRMLTAMEAEVRQQAPAAGMSPEAANKMIERMYEDTETNQVRKLYGNKDVDPNDVIKSLNDASKWTHVKQGRREVLIREGGQEIKNRDSAAEKSQKIQERDAKTGYQAWSAGMLERLDPSNPDRNPPTWQEFNDGLRKYAGVITREETNAMRSVFNAPQMEGGVKVPGLYEQWLSKILVNAKGMSDAQIYNAVGEGPGKGLTLKEANTLVAHKRKEETESGVTSTEQFKQGIATINLVVGRISPASPLMGELSGFLNQAQADKLNAARVEFYRIADRIYRNQDPKKRTMDDLIGEAARIANNWRGPSESGTGGTSGSGSSSGGIPTSGGSNEIKGTSSSRQAR